MPPSNLLTIYTYFTVANPAHSDVFLRIPRHGIRSKKEIKCFVQGAGVIRSERWLAECAVACRKSGLFTVWFSGKYLSLDTTTVRTLAFIFLCFRCPVGAKPTWTPWPRWRLDRQPPEVLPANTLCNPLAVVARPRHSNSILSLMQSSLTRHTIGPRIVSSEEDDYLLDAPSPRPLFDDGSDQGSDLFAPSSPPTEGGGTLSSINPTQCIGERSITPSDFKGSADEDDDLELLVERIKSWSLSRDVFGELLDDMNFPELQDCAEIKNLTEAQWQDLLSFIQENTSILRFFKFYYMSKTGTVHITSRAPGSNHEGGVHALFEGFKHNISLSQYQVFVEDHNRRVVAREVGEIPDSIVVIYYRRPIRDILADIVVFESAASQSVQSVVGALVSEMADCEEPAKVERAEGVGDGEVQNDTKPYHLIKPRLFCSIKYIYVKFQPGMALKKQGIEEGGDQDDIDVVSAGYQYCDHILCPRMKAFWFAFHLEDRDMVEALNTDLRTCWDWVAQGYAVLLLSTYNREKLVHSDLYPEARIDQILSAHAKVMKHWQDGVANARTLAVRQCTEAGWCQAMTLREVDYSKVPLEDPLRGHHSVAELKHMGALVLKQSREDVASIDAQNNGPIANPIPIFLQAIRDGCFQHADGKYSKNGYHHQRQAQEVERRHLRSLRYR
ncbi:hypothetical protein C8Q72DRAFT_793017 [Fomitopsis betulina]|nr:hypothetical protein C8Q72DRAFT_793017 [Fomitopsis betulina]